jgi:hypothetical protein
MMYLTGVLLLLALVDTWCIWRVLKMVGVLLRMEARLSNLVVSVGMLADTTEACFQAVAGQLQSGAPLGTPETVRTAARRQRLAGAARRGQSAVEIAAREGLSEAEVDLGLRLQLARPRRAEAQEGSHAPLHS